ncbi:YmaF family protein [Caldanaerobius polysaccharolyticus]|uniref:YmaF family protein n=1 Tax=Caldanaerobius polysaccharolyticus TaxID=44256 RepID=UPI00047D50AD|nr:YmaF family protein [Caldanaerobius polysaccharolyticus]
MDLSIEEIKKYFDYYDKKGEGQTHNHEFLGSTKLAAEEEEEEHNHRFAGVTSQVIPKGSSHVHAILVSTDFYEDHHHEIGVITGPAIDVGDDKHVHFVEGKTTVDNNHFHNFTFATLIEDPISD